MNSKIIYGLERLSDAFKTLLWEKAKQHNISPIQIQIILFITNHKTELCNVSHLAREFNITKPTVSDAVRVLIKKGYLNKDHSNQDNRSYNLFVTDSGKEIIEKVSGYTTPLQTALKASNKEQLEDLYSAITVLIDKLNRQGVIQVQRTCFGCRFYENKGQKHHCNLLNKVLQETEIRLDCSEYEENEDRKKI